ncbi:MAG: Hsp20/alpha crystallin family protein [Phycisphaerae bacterium]|nr:Hsp20/alpha crystallin family protein [Phycisphaerae bacterium]
MWFDQWSPFFDVEKTLAEMDRILGDVSRPLELRSVPRGAFPAINIYDEGGVAVVYAELPGVKAQGIDVSVLNETLTIKAQRKADESDTDRHYRRERVSGDFVRTVTLPDPVNPDSVKAHCANGVLTVRMEKAAQAKAKKIQIHS